MLIFLALLGSCSADQQGGPTTQPGTEEAGSRPAKTSPGETTSPSEKTRTDPARTTAQATQSEGRGYLVPVVHLTSMRENVNTRKLSGTQELAVPQDYQDAVAGLLEQPDLRSFDSAAAVLDHVSRTPEATGLVPWDEVDPRVKALAVNGEDLLTTSGNEPEGYPLKPENGEAPDPGQLRRVVIGGDIVLDRGQNYMVIQQGMGLDFPLDGGYAAVNSRVAKPSAASEFGVIHQFTAERRGGTGAIREYLSDADLTLANLENPVVEDAVWHPDAPTFTGHPQLLPILEQAGMDGVTLGNNHILDAGPSGLQETIGYMENFGISYTGAGENLEAAREPMIFELGETRVGVLNYQGVPSYDWSWATDTYPGTAPMKVNLMREDVEALDRRVDLVFVMPQWGYEYTATPEPVQVEFARAAVDAGADLVVGGHGHWPKGVEVYKDNPIFYGTGNFLFDQSWSEETSTGIFAEITLYGDRVIQAEPVPFIILDKAQPNFLVPEAGGNRALRKIFSASVGPEFEAYERRPATP